MKIALVFTSLIIGICCCQSAALAASKHGLGRTDRQILANLNEYFPSVTVREPIRGQLCRKGQSVDKIAVIEILGDPKDVTRASAMMGMVDNAYLATYVFFTLMENALPHWSGGESWFIAALNRISASSGDVSEETTVGSATVKLSSAKQSGFLLLVIER